MIPFALPLPVMVVSPATSNVIFLEIVAPAAVLPFSLNLPLMCTVAPSVAAPTASLSVAYVVVSSSPIQIFPSVSAAGVLTIA